MFYCRQVYSTHIFKQAAWLFVCLCAVVMMANGQQREQNALTRNEKKLGWVLLFNGNTPEGWTKANGQAFPEKGWKIIEGILTVVEGEKGGDIATVEEYEDFEFSVDFLMVKACNSGIKYFYTNYTKGGALGMEYQLLDDAAASDNKLAHHLCGSLYDIFSPNELLKKVNQPGQWNTARIVCHGLYVEHWLNGIKILAFERGSDEYMAAVGASKYKTTPAFGLVKKGRILLQDHGHAISFRNIRIRKL